MALTPDQADAICGRVQRGVDVRISIEVEGLHGDDVMRRVDEGREPKFEAKLRKAKATFLAGQQVLLTQAAVGYRTQDGGHREADWRVTESMLARNRTEDDLDRLRRLTT